MTEDRPQTYDDMGEAIDRLRPPPREPRVLVGIGGAGSAVGKGQRIAGNRPICTLTDEIFDNIVKHVRAGNFRTVAAQAEGISLHTFHKWIQRGREQLKELEDGRRNIDDELPLQAQLVMAIEHAEGQSFITEHGKVLDENGDVRDRALRLTWMKARYARVFSQPSEVVDDQNATAEKVDVRELLLARIEAIKAAYP
jgi:hypothetical protein